MNTLPETGLELNDVYAQIDRGPTYAGPLACRCAGGPDEGPCAAPSAACCTSMTWIGCTTIPAGSGSQNHPLFPRCPWRRRDWHGCSRPESGSGVIAGGESTQQALDRIWMHPQVRTEIGELVTTLVNRRAINSAGHEPDIPLQVHASYTRSRSSRRSAKAMPLSLPNGGKVSTTPRESGPISWHSLSTRRAAGSHRPRGIATTRSVATDPLGIQSTTRATARPV